MRPKPEVDVLDLLGSLIDQSMVHTREHDGRTRYYLLETIHAYALDKLRGADEEGNLRDRHLAWYHGLAQRIEQLHGQDEKTLLDGLEIERENLRAAIQHRGGFFEHRLEVANAAAQMWNVRGPWTEARTTLDSLIADTREEQDNHQAECAKVTHNIAHMAYLQGDYQTARRLFGEALRIRRELGDRHGIAQSIDGLGLVASVRGDEIAGAAHHREALTIRRELGDKDGLAQSLNNLGALASLQGDLTSAYTYLTEALDIRRELGDKRGIAACLQNLGSVARERGDYATAKVHYDEALGTQRELGDHRSVAQSLNNLGVIADLQHDYATARQCHQEALGLRRELGDKRGIATSLGNLGIIALLQGDHATAYAHQREALAIKRELGDKRGIAASLNNLGNIAYELEDYTTALDHHHECLGLRRELDDKRGTAMTLINLGDIAYSQGDYTTAHDHDHEALAICSEIGALDFAIHCLEGLGHVLAATNRPAAAARLYGAAAHIRSDLAAQLGPPETERSERVNATREALEPGAFDEAFAQGAALTSDEAIAEALTAAQRRGRGAGSAGVVEFLGPEEAL